MSSITNVHATTWNYFANSLLLADCFIGSPKVVMEEIMTDINDLVQEFQTSSNGAIAASLFAMRRLFEILLECSQWFNVCFDIISVLRPTST